MAATAEERIPALNSSEDIFSLAVPFAACSENRIGENAPEGQKSHQGIFSKNRTIAVGATRAKWSGTHQDSGRWWPKTVLEIAIDANGNTLADASGKSYTWDFENRLTQAVVPGTGTVTFKYDPFGRRIEKSSWVGTTNYLYDGPNAVEEVDSGGSVLARYVHDRAVDQPLSELRSGTNEYYQVDGIGSVASLSNSAGVLGNTYTYDAFGKLTASAGTFTNPFEYTSRDFDAETGLFYYRARYYDSGVGRFISEDPIGLSGGINQYAYVRNEPTTLVDPFGLDSGPWHPPAGVKTKCLDTDTCQIIQGKMWILERMIDSHEGWDSHMPAPRGGDRHSRPSPGNPMGEIGQLYKQWFDCFDLYKEQCKDDKPCDKTPVPQTRMPVNS
jgi:RHS repeat-associated protein